MKRVVLSVLLLACLLAPVRAQNPDDLFVQVYSLIIQGDTLQANQRTGPAQERYREAQKTLLELEKEFPLWNQKIVSYRKKYLAERLDEVVASPAVPATAPGAAVGREPQDERLAMLNQEITNLRNERELLQAKLREALSVQPAPVDPRELMSAEQRIRELTAENAGLRTTLGQLNEQAVPAIDPALLTEAQSRLVEANSLLARQDEELQALARERQTLQDRLKKRESAEVTVDPQALEQAQKALKDAWDTMAQQESKLASLVEDKSGLEQRIVHLNQEVATARSPIPDPAPAAALDAAQARIADLDRQLQQARQELIEQRSQAEALAAEKSTLERRVAELAARPVVPAPDPKAEKTERTAMKRLEKERDDLRKTVAALNRDLEKRKKKQGPLPTTALEEQVASLRARVAAYEASPVPYSAEELALFKQEATVAGDVASRPPRRPARELSATANSLVVEARRAFQSRELELAEQKYVEALRVENRNAEILTDLAATQIERGRLAEAETSLRQALVEDPGSARALSLQGLLRFRQGNFDGSVESLSRAAQLDPEDARTQNYLGIALSQKGLRKPAETALRRAVLLQPGYGEAQNNLAVIYATQEPPFLELARWHYQRALASGHPKNAELEKLLAKP
ncbi:MAG: tetratricopeptide repeat protein [Limisphaerales bacterium]